VLKVGEIVKKRWFFATIVVIGFIFYFYTMQVLNFSIKVSESFISSHLIPSTFDGIRIIQFSDLLIENEQDLKLLENTIIEIEKLNPDIVVFTGNLFYENTFTPTLGTSVKALLADISPTLGKVAVLGAADMSQEESITEVLTDSDFRVLRNESLELFNGSMTSISFIGVDSLSTNPNLDHLLPELSTSDKFNILLLNEPSLAWEVTNYPIEVQLSGYCRGTKLAIANLDNTYCSQFSQGTYRFADHLFLNVNKGLNRPNHFTTLLRRPTIDSFLLIRE